MARFVLASIGIAAILMAAASGSCRSQALIGSSRFYKAVSAGHTVKITSFSSLDPDCRSRGVTEVNVIRPPTGGEVDTRRGSDFPSFSVYNVRARCDRQRVPATILLYHANLGFSGVDTFDVEALFPDGYARKFRYAVVVR